MRKADDVKIAYVTSPGRGDLDMILKGFADTLMARGVSVAGVVQVNTDCGPDRPCDMDVIVLPAGPVLRISQDLGPGSRGCRLDPMVLEEAVGLVGGSLTEKPELLLINKFGKQEADGRGFRPLIGEALAQGIPVVVGVNGLNREAFEAFTDGAADPVAPDQDSLMAWFDGDDALAPL